MPFSFIYHIIVTGGYGMSALKPDKDSQIYKKSEIKEVILENVTPRNITTELVGIDVIGVLKKAKDTTEISFDIPKIVKEKKVKRKKDKTTKKPRLKNANRYKLENFESNDDSM
jgi:hypothetical protein